MIASAIVLALLSGQPAPRATCSLRQVDACETAYDLVVHPEFRRALTRFAGKARGDYIRLDDGGNLRGEQFLAAIGVLDGSAVTRMLAGNLL